MQISTKKESLYINHVIGKKTDTIVIEEDFIVPDIKPDVLNIISSNGNVCIYKKEVMDGKLKIDGCINTYIIYFADASNSNTRGLNTNLEFSKIIEFPSIQDGMNIDTRLILKNIECKVINGRKINIKAILDVEIKVISNEEVEFINEIEDCKNVQLLNENLELNSLLGRGTTKVYAKDTLVINDIDNLSEILNMDLKIINKELKISYNKVLIKADVCTKMLYLTEDNRISKVEAIIPIMGFVDMKDIDDEDICNIEFEVKNIVIKPNSIDEHSIYVEIEIEVECEAYKNKTINLIQDLYSPNTNLVCNQKNIKAISQKKRIKDMYSIRENTYIEEIGNSKLYDVEVNPIILKQTNMNGKVLIDGETKFRFIFNGKNSMIETKEMSIPFNYIFDIPSVTLDSEVEIELSAILEDFTTMPDKNIDIKIDLNFDINMNNLKTINVIDDITEEEIKECDRNSLIIYFVKPGDTLWKIAKRFHSTMQNIIDVNNIEDENKINVGEQLFIPTCM